VDLDLGCGELHSRWRQPPQGEHSLAAAHDRDLDDLALARRHHHADGARLGALALRVGRVLDVAAGVDSARRAAQRRADRKARVGHVRLGARGAGGGEEVVHGGAHRSFT
jgi:hypothetical protein